MDKAALIAYFGSEHKAGAFLGISHVSVNGWGNVPDGRQYELEVKTFGRLTSDHTAAALDKLDPKATEAYKALWRRIELILTGNFALSQCPVSDMGTDEEHLLLEATKVYLDATGTSAAEFIRNSLLPILQQAGIEEDAPDSDADQYEKFVGAAVKKYQRILTGAQPMPLKIKLHWLAALPVEYRDEVNQALAAVIGSYYVPVDVRPRSQKPVKATLQHLTRKFSDVLGSSAPAADGVYDSNDNPDEVRLMLDELHELIAAAIAEYHRLSQGTGLKSRFHNMLLTSPATE